MIRNHVATHAGSGHAAHSHARPHLACPVRVKAPATCGELIQGHLDGEDFLVNCPIDLFAEAKVQPVAMPGLHVHASAQHGKIVRALEVAARDMDARLAHALSVHSPIPRGKGMASSTADITAALAAYCMSAGIELDDAALGELICRIEPSDGVHFPGIAHVNHLTGECHASLPVPQGLRVLILDCGGEVDTVTFDRERARRMYREHRSEVARMLETLKLGLQHHDLNLVGVAATSSALLSQLVLPKAPFDTVLELTLREGGLGVNCAHSGTVLGVMYADDEPLRGAHLHEVMTSALGDRHPVVGDFAVIGGGVHAAA